MKILDGRALAASLRAELKSQIAELGTKPTLGAVVVGQDAVVERFVAEKEKVAQELGVKFRRYSYPAEISTNDLRTRIAGIVHNADPDAVIIQLPLPGQVNAQYILNAVPPGQDVDVLSARSLGLVAAGRSPILPPVVGAVRCLLHAAGVDHRERSFVLVGAGALVGRPLALWLLSERATFSVVRFTTPDISVFTRVADVVISGAGQPGLIRGDMIKDGAVVIDAGTAESEGKIIGDVDLASVQERAAAVAPVPGGVGPLTVAMVFQNLVALARAKKQAKQRMRSQEAGNKS